MTVVLQRHRVEYEIDCAERLCTLHYTVARVDDSQPFGLRHSCMLYTSKSRCNTSGEHAIRNPNEALFLFSFSDITCGRTYGVDGYNTVNMADV